VRHLSRVSSCDVSHDKRPRKFDRQYADDLKRRAEAARAHEAIRVLKALARPEPAPAKPSALAFAQQTRGSERI
jgi:hypothetical protein